MLAARAEAAARTLLVVEEVWGGPRQSRGAADTSTTSKVLSGASAASAAANIAAAEAFAAADFSDGNLGPDSTAAGQRRLRTGPGDHGEEIPGHSGKTRF